MNGFDSPAVLWILIAAQFSWHFQCLACQAERGLPCQAVSQYSVFGILPLMGVATLVALAVGPGCWMAFRHAGVMVLTVTCDFRGSREAATW